MLIVSMFVIIGLCLGSYFNVVVFRGLETERSHCKGSRSECPQCGHKLKALDLIPVFSWCFLGGKCRYCKNPISIMYPVGEALTAVGFGVLGYEVNKLWYASGGQFRMAYWDDIILLAIMLVTIIVLSISTISDLREKQIYVAPVYLGIAAIALLRVAQFFVERHQMGEFFSEGVWVGRLVAFVSIIIINAAGSRLLAKKLGGGDFDIFLLLYICGWFNTMFNTLFIASIVGCVYALIMALLRKFTRQTAIPMVPLMYIGYLSQVFITLIDLGI